MDIVKELKPYHEALFNPLVDVRSLPLCREMDRMFLIELKPERVCDALIEYFLLDYLWI